MIKTLKIYFFLLIFFLSGCAIVPVNRFHTGKVLDPGKVKLGSALYEAKDVSSSFLNTEAPNRDEDVFPALELFGRVGILKRWDAALRLVSPIPIPVPFGKWNSCQKLLFQPFGKKQTPTKALLKFSSFQAWPSHSIFKN